jgi:hypothetical protein
MLALTLASLLSSSNAATPPTGGAAPWEELNNAQGWQDVAEGVFPLNPFILVPPAGSGISNTHCMGADMPDWNLAVLERSFVILNSSNASQDYAIRRAVYAWNSSDDSNGTPDRTHAGVELRMDISGTSSATPLTVEDFAGVDTGNGHPGNGTNEIVLVDDAFFDALATEFDPAFPTTPGSPWTYTNAVTLVWAEADPLVHVTESS